MQDCKDIPAGWPGRGLIQYEIYRDPGSGEIYKIISIQEKNEELELTD